MHFILPIVVFTSGAVVMILELAGARIIAPYLGTSILVWTSLIGVFLAALSCGYFIGGRIADRFPKPATLAYILFGASALVATSAHFEYVLRLTSAFSDLRAGAITAVLILFAPATVFLGMVSPVAVKLSLSRLESAGRTVGNLYAISNTGSIVGTFLGGFILISYFGSTRIVLMLALTLAFLAILVSLSLRVRIRLAPLALIAMLVASGILFPSTLILARNQTLVADIETNYSRNWIFDMRINGEPVRVLSNIIDGYQIGMNLNEPNKLLASYLQFFNVFEILNPSAARALTLGGSAYVYPRHFLQGGETRTIDVVEIDPEITEIAQTYFGLTEDPRMRIIHEDGRVFLKKNTEKYDVIFLDAFRNDLSIPFHLTTREMMQSIENSLAENGIVITNVVGPLAGNGTDFVHATYATYKETFEHVDLYQLYFGRDPSDIQNLVLVASNVPFDSDEEITEKFPLARKIDAKSLQSSLPVLTDDFAPVERYFLGM